MASKNIGRKSSSVFQFVIYNFSSFGGSSSEISKRFFVGKTPWKVTVKRTQQNDDDGGVSSYLGYYVCCEGLEFNGDMRSCQATVFLDILHGKDKDGVEPLERGFKHNFTSSKNVGFSSFSRLDKVQEPNLGWINDDKVRFEVTVHSEGLVSKTSISENPSKKVKMDALIDLTKDDEIEDEDPSPTGVISVSKEASERPPQNFPSRDSNFKYNVEQVVMGIDGQEERITPVMVNGVTVWLGVVPQTKVEVGKEEINKPLPPKDPQVELPIEATDIFKEENKVLSKSDVCIASCKSNNNTNITDQEQKHFEHLDRVVKRSPNNKIPEAEVIWFKFTSFLNIRRTKKTFDVRFNPFKATLKDIVEFILFIDLTDRLILDREYLGAIIGCLKIKIENWSWDRSLNKIIIDLKRRPLADKFIEELLATQKATNLSPTRRLISDFESYCATENLIPSNVTSENLVNFVFFVLQSPVPDRRHLVSGKSFVDIGNRISSILDKSLGKDFMESPEFEGLQATLLACDEGLTSNAAALKTLPEYSYVRCITEQMSSSKFWNQSLIRNALVDVRKDNIPINLVAMELGVTAEMLYSVLQRNYQLKKGELPSLKEFEMMEEAASTSFWEFSKIKLFLDGVRDTKLLAHEVSVHFGVSRKEILRRCGGVKSKEELEAEAELIRMKKLEAREESFMSRLENTDLDKQIWYAKSNEANLCEYEKKRLENLEDRKMLLQSLDFMEDKIEIRRLNQVIRTPDESDKSSKLPKREKSSRIKRQAENRRLQNSEPQKVSRVDVAQRSTPMWFGYRFKVPHQTAYNTNLTVPKVNLRSDELLEITRDYRKSRIFLDSITEEYKEQKVETKYNVGTNWSLFSGGEEFIVSTSRVTAIDTLGDFTTYGTEQGGVGVLVAGRSVTLRPHAEAVTGLLTSGSRILSAARDGTVRNTDMESQTVDLEYSWDMCSQAGEGKHGVLGMVQRAAHSYVLHCSDKIVNLDVRQKEAQSLTRMSNLKFSYFSNIKMNPAKDNMFTTCSSDTVSIWDLRKMSDPVWNLNVGGDVDFCGWNSSGKEYALTKNTGVWVYDSPSGVPSTSFRVSWPKSGFRSFPNQLGGDLWCPWPGEDSTLFNVRVGSLGLKSAQKVARLSGINTKK